MAEELTRALERRAERGGTPRGATAVLAQAQWQVTAAPEMRPSRRRGPAIAIATAVAVLLVGAGFLLATRLLDVEPSPVVTTIPESTTIPATTIPVPTAVDVDALVWSRVPYDAVFENVWIGSVTVFDGRLVAVGEDAEGAAVWTSPNGFSWTRVNTAPGLEGSRFREVAAGGPGLVAIGYETVWTSPDGITWTSSDQAFDGQLEAITGGGPGLVLVGDGLVYTSVDGAEWTAAQCPGCSPTGGFDYLADVAAGGTGLVAVGNTTDAGDGPAFVWTSPDGLTWTRSPLGEVVEMESVTAGGPGFVAVGHSSAGARVVTSLDGTTWSLVPHDDEVFGGSLMRNVIAAGDGLVALGEWSWGEGQAWTSPNGISWSNVPYDQEVFTGAAMLDAVAFGDGVVAVGGTSEIISFGGSTDAVGPIWIAAPADSPTPTAPSAAGPVAPTAAGSSPTAPPLVTGESINPWQKTEIDAGWARGRGVLDLTSLPDGGFAATVARGRGILWSRDGISWQETDLDAEMGQPGEEDSLTALPGRVAVLRNEATGPVVWVGDLATGAWDAIPLGAPGLADQFATSAIAANDREVLVVAESEDYAGRGETASTTDHRVAYLIDPEKGVVRRQTLTLPSSERDRFGPDELAAVWFADRWVVAAGNVTAVSHDGLVWSSAPDANGLAAENRYVTSLTAGRDRVVATTCGGWGPHLVWYSEDGLEWVQAPSDVPGPHSGTAYSDELGFAVVVEGRVFTSDDGETWHWTQGPGWDLELHDIAASGYSVFVVADPPFLLAAARG